MSAYARLVVGSYTRAQGKGISVVDWNGGKPEVRSVWECQDPSFLCFHPHRPIIYAVNECPSGAVSAFHLERNGTLRNFGTRPTGGAAPCHLAAHPSGNWLVVSNYRGASVAVLPLKPDGAPEEAVSFLFHSGTSADPVRQAQAHPHGVYWTQDGRELFVPDLGTDQIAVYGFDPNSGELRLQQHLQLPRGAGPRHLGFALRFDALYCLCELDSTLVTVERQGGTWLPSPPRSIVPPDNIAGGAAEIAVHASGRWLLCSNRGTNGLTSFSIENGAPTPRFHQFFATLERTPRHFCLTGEGRSVFVAFQDDHAVARFDFDPGSGLLRDTGERMRIESPACVLAVPASMSAAISEA